MNVDEVHEFFKQDNIEAIRKVQALKLAIVWRVYLGLPQEACQGGCENKNFILLDSWFRSQKDTERISFIRKVGGLLVLWNTAQKIVRQQDFQGYHHYIVSYTIAWLLHLTSNQINLDKIWNNQMLSPSITDVLETMSKIVNEHIRSTDLDVNEYCKSEQ